MVSKQAGSLICVVGCGNCGSRIADYFDKTPSYVPHTASAFYPIKCAAIDADRGIERRLPKSPWDWRDTRDIHIIPVAF